jgi:hypothetical protein
MQSIESEGLKINDKLKRALIRAEQDTVEFSQIVRDRLQEL